MDATAAMNDVGSTIFRQQFISLKGGALFLREPQITDLVATGGLVQIDAIVSNGALIIGDADECARSENPCDPGFFDDIGYCYELRVSPEWTETEGTGPSCVPVTELGTGDNSHQFSIPGPESAGEFTVQYTLEALGTNETGTAIQTIDVTDEPTPPPNGGNGNGNGNGQNGDGGPDLATVGLIGLLGIGAIAAFRGSNGR